MKTEYRRDAQGKYLVLRIRSRGFEKIIPVEDVGKFACDHDTWTSDDKRCWDCGAKVRR
ncbi:MAG: hypothetical protein HYW79_00770 [Parcubacteria group bacterium]|nr:hypothetical protein [Parcubacteria group bacterium]